MFLYVKVKHFLILRVAFIQHPRFQPNITWLPLLFLLYYLTTVTEIKYSVNHSYRVLGNAGGKMHYEILFETRDNNSSSFLLMFLSRLFLVFTAIGLGFNLAWFGQTH